MQVADPKSIASETTVAAGVRYGYSATATAGCTPVAAISAIPSTAKISQLCYQVLGSRSPTSHVLTRAPTGSAVVISKPLSYIFTEYDTTCGITPIRSVTSNKSYCTVGASPDYAISCSLTTNSGYSGPVEITVNQDGNPDYKAVFNVSLPAGINPNPPDPKPAKETNTTAIILGVVGGIVGIGIVIGVVWYIKKRK